jgi:hypothetical protein
MNTVWLYTLLRVAEWYLPAAVPGLQSTMAKFKLDHREVSKDPTTMAGAGNFVADVWVKFGQQVRQHPALPARQIVQGQGTKPCLQCRTMACGTSVRVLGPVSPAAAAYNVFGNSCIECNQFLLAFTMWYYKQ